MKTKIYNFLKNNFLVFGFFMLVFSVFAVILTEKNLIPQKGRKEFQKNLSIENNKKSTIIDDKIPDNKTNNTAGNDAINNDAKKSYPEIKKEIISAYKGKTPKQWGEKIPGVKTRLDTDKKVIALTFDADRGGYDRKLIDFLEKEKIPATLFVTGKWIDEYQNIFIKLAKNPLFEIENHGTNHKPCSAIGKSAYGIKGTANISEMADEIELNAEKIELLTGNMPKFYRPATSYLDETCIDVAGKLGYEIVNFNILGDAGATYSKDRVKRALLGATPGAIVIMHMNHPESGTSGGIIGAIPELKKQGFTFAKLADYPLK